MPKRKAPASVGYSDATGSASNKRSALSQPTPKATPNSTPRKRVKKDSDTEDNCADPKQEPKDEPSDKDSSYSDGIIQRAFYPPEMSNARCAQYNDGTLPRPMDVLTATLASTADARAKIPIGDAVVHWFKRDLRINDNRGLSMAAAKAAQAGVPLVAVFVVCGQEYQAHLTSAARVDFELRTLAVLKADLAALDIPLLVADVEDRKKVPEFLVQRFEEWGAKHVFCNIEYEVDELRRETKLVKKCLDHGISFSAVHDDVVVPPGTLKTGQGRQYAVYTPWFRSWLAHLHAHPTLLTASPAPPKNPPSTRTNPALAPLFSTPIPSAPPNKSLDPEHQKRLAKLWPAGEHEALRRLDKFLAEKAAQYKEARNFPAAGGTAVVSVHHAAGTLAARTSVRRARDANGGGKLDAGNAGVAGWIGEVAWRDFYKHVLAHWPYVCMHKPFKYEYTNITWENDSSHLAAWKRGQTGYPIVDAAMRQLSQTAYLPNRVRMITASFLAKDLLLDWRLGEAHFMLSLVDGDFASNNGGWGFAASVGVDPQPYFRVFNPVLQSERFDSEGVYIRRWVPELRGVEGKKVHDPYGRGAGEEARREGYPRPVVLHKEARTRALERFKEGVGRETA